MDKAIPLFKSIRDHLTRNLYIQDFARKLNIKDELIIQRLKPAPGSKTIINNDPGEEGLQTPEKFLLKLILKNPEIIPKINNDLGIADFSDEGLQKLFLMILKRSREGTSLEPDVIINFIEDDDLKNFVAETILDADEFGDDPVKTSKECIRRIRSKRLLAEAEKLNIMIRNSSDEAELMNLLKSKQALIEEKRRLKKLQD
ncbi:MAG: hypothetical protein SV062_01770 [Thermodesulfobacteriota bacterium]|nr:hypothetical protein [Thermodesulfobacteriota bacterium]